MTLNLPSLYFFWLEEYGQTSPNKNQSPNLWHVTSILVCCIFVMHNGRQKSRWKSHKSAWWLSSLGNELSTGTGAGGRGNDFKVLFIFLSFIKNIHRYSQNFPSVALRSTADDTLLELCLFVNFKKWLLTIIIKQYFCLINFSAIFSWCQLRLAWKIQGKYFL